MAEKYFNTISYQAEIGDKVFGSRYVDWVDTFIKANVGEYEKVCVGDTTAVFDGVLTNDVIYDIVKYGKTVGQFITRFTCE